MNMANYQRTPILTIFFQKKNRWPFASKKTTHTKELNKGKQLMGCKHHHFSNQDNFRTFSSSSNTKIFLYLFRLCIIPIQLGFSFHSFFRSFKIHAGVPSNPQDKPSKNLWSTYTTYLQQYVYV